MLAKRYAVNRSSPMRVETAETNDDRSPNIRQSSIDDKPFRCETSYTQMNGHRAPSTPPSSKVQLTVQAGVRILQVDSLKLCDVIMESTKDMEFDQELVAAEELEAEEQLEPEEHFEAENKLITEKEYGKDVILTSLVLIHDHQMGICLICTIFPLSSFVPMGFLDKVAMSTTEERSSHNRNKHLIEALTTEMGQIFDIHLNQIRQGHHKARKRKEQELKSKPPDNSLRSIQSRKQDYLEWEKNMDEWFSYKNFLSEMRFVCALSHLTGDAYKWWLQEVDDRLYYKEPPITLWRDLKKLLRNKYAPQALECTPKGNPKIQGLAAQEKEQGLAPYSKKNPIAEQQLKDKILKILNAYNKPKKVKSTSQPKMVTEEVVIHKQNRQPSLASSGEQKQCHTMEHENDKTEGSTKEENHHLVSTTSQACRADYVSKITILNMKGRPYVSQPVLNRELPKQEPRELGGFTQVEAVMVHKQSPRGECNIFFKDKPPDATPPFKTRGCTLWGAIKKTNEREISTHHMSQSRDPREDYQNQLRLKHMEECIEEPEMDISSFSTFHTYQWRPGELLDSSREEEFVTNNALIQKEPPDPTPLPLVMMIPSTEHIVNLTQNGALIKVEPCLLVYNDFMTMITHLLFAKGVDNIAGIKEEPPDLEFLMSNLFKRTGIGVVLKPKVDYPSNRTRRKSDNAYELELQGKYNVSSNFNDSYLVVFIVGELDLRSNPFQVGEGDVIMESTKDMEFDQELVAAEELEAEDQLEPEEHFEAENELITEKEYGKDVILTSLVLIHDHQMGMCLICSLFPLSSFVPMGFLDKVIEFLVSLYAMSEVE
ncbi:hypothetical protein ISN44_As04g005620 [Arabidopsis suecica]|uniref:Retrotransposon gag domain-containing protein n=1 Tax=Arabidopsis suecica TaxID=45249 RepID=A0A8T2EJE2_ARASU|nr:hypothetical protein ISN44_As04g005620 [Arabidopsis suecica]